MRRNLIPICLLLLTAWSSVGGQDKPKPAAATTPLPPAAVPKTPTPAKVVEKQAPPAKVPEKQAPPAKVAETQAPPAKVAEAHAPPAKVAEKQAPPAKVAETQAPPAKVAETHAPPAKVTETHAPPAKVTETHAPPAKVTETKAPHAKVPEPPVPHQEEKVAAKASTVLKLGVLEVKIGLTYSDKRTTDWTDVNKGHKLSAPLGPLDGNDRLTVKVKTVISPHQVFLLLRNKATHEEVGFIGQAEPEASTEYKIDVDFSNSGFDAGTYELVLYLGDFLIEDSIEWIVGDLSFKAAPAEHQLPPQRQINPLYTISYDEKEEIKHMFRLPEPRPARIVSNAFTLLVLSPILVLLILWGKIGVNLSNFPFTLSALAFHIGLAAIFGVYTLFWIKLTMFEALKWMTIPGLLTFVAGNRLLSYIAEKRAK